jgi:hypothetical protein
MNNITVKAWLDLPESERPAVTYKGYRVAGVYKDQAYKDCERYVITLDSYTVYGVGGKKPEALLDIVGDVNNGNV